MAHHLSISYVGNVCAFISMYCYLSKKRDLSAKSVLQHSVQVMVFDCCLNFEVPLL